LKIGLEEPKTLAAIGTMREIRNEPIAAT